jgi:hypothetical protein
LTYPLYIRPITLERHILHLAETLLFTLQTQLSEAQPCSKIALSNSSALRPSVSQPSGYPTTTPNQLSTNGAVGTVAREWTSKTSHLLQQFQNHKNRSLCTITGHGHRDLASPVSRHTGFRPLHRTDPVLKTTIGLASQTRYSTISTVHGWAQK